MLITKTETYTIPQSVDGKELANEIIELLKAKGGFEGMTESTITIIIYAKFNMEIEKVGDEDAVD